MKNKQSGQKGTIRERMKHAADSLKERTRNMNEETQMNQEAPVQEAQAEETVDVADFVCQRLLADHIVTGFHSFDGDFHMFVAAAGVDDQFHIFIFQKF